jgi:O-antigen/teichoic acid export membrane protein
MADDDNNIQSGIFSRYLSKLFGVLVTGLVNIGLLAVVPRHLGASDYGFFVYLQNFFFQFFGLVDAGTSSCFYSKLCAQPNRLELLGFYSVYAFAALFLGLFFCVTIFLFGLQDYVFSAIPIDLVFLGCFFCFLMWALQVVVKLADAYGRTILVESIKAAQRLFVFSLVLLVASSAWLNVRTYFLINIATLMVIVIIALAIIFRVEKINISAAFSFKLRAIGNEFLKYSSPLLAYGLVAFTVGIFDFWLLQNKSGSSAVGEYGFAFGLAAIAMTLSASMTPLIIRQFSFYFSKDDRPALVATFQRYIPMFYGLTAFVSVAIFYNSGLIVQMVGGDEMNEASLVFTVLALYPIHQTLGQLCGGYFFATGDTRRYRNIGAFSFSVGIPITYLMVSVFEWSGFGLALKVVFVQFIAVHLQMYFACRALSVSVTKIFINQTLILIMFLVFGYFSFQQGAFGGNPIHLILQVGVYFAAGIAIVILMPKSFGLSRHDIGVFYLRAIRLARRR